LNIDPSKLPLSEQQLRKLLAGLISFQPCKLDARWVRYSRLGQDGFFWQWLSRRVMILKLWRALRVGLWTEL
jgi:hypothetical protein